MLKPSVALVIAILSAGMPADAAACDLDLFGLFRPNSERTCHRTPPDCVLKTRCETIVCPSPCVSSLCLPELAGAAPPAREVVEKTSFGSRPRWTITDTKKGLIMIDQREGKVYGIVDGKWQENKDLQLPPM